MSSDTPTRYMLTTFDNPYNPFTQFIEWHNWDVTAGYNTSSLLGRVIADSPNLSETDQELAIQLAIDEILAENVSGMFRKVSDDGLETLEPSSNS